MVDRMDRVAEMIKREVSVILQEEINDPRVRHLTITRVEVTRDLKLARIFYIIFGNESEKSNVMRGLRSASGFIRGALAGRISMKFIPRISFREDRNVERKESIDSIFEKIDRENRNARNSNEEGAHNG